MFCLPIVLKNLRTHLTCTLSYFRGKILYLLFRVVPTFSHGPTKLSVQVDLGHSCEDRACDIRNGPRCPITTNDAATHMQ